MAYCPKCKGEMPQTAAKCPHCQFDFPLESPAGEGVGTGFAYSPLADFALFVSMLAASIGTGAAAIGSIVAVFQGHFFEGLFLGPLAFFLQLGMLVTFLRVAK